MSPIAIAVVVAALGCIALLIVAAAYFEFRSNEGATVAGPATRPSSPANSRGATGAGPAARTSTPSSIVPMLRSEVRRSLDSRVLVLRFQGRGFQITNEDVMGLWMVCEHGTLILTVFASHHEWNIFALAYMGNGPDEDVVHVVTEGRITG